MNINDMLASQSLIVNNDPGFTPIAMSLFKLQSVIAIQTTKLCMVKIIPQLFQCTRLYMCVSKCVPMKHLPLERHHSTRGIQAPETVGRGTKHSEVKMMRRGNVLVCIAVHSYTKTLLKWWCVCC